MFTCDSCGDEYDETTQSTTDPIICIYCQFDNEALDTDWHESGDFDYSMNY